MWLYCSRHHFLVFAIFHLISSPCSFFIHIRPISFSLFLCSSGCDDGEFHKIYLDNCIQYALYISVEEKMEATTTTATKAEKLCSIAGNTIVPLTSVAIVIIIAITTIIEINRPFDTFLCIMAMSVSCVCMRTDIFHAHISSLRHFSRSLSHSPIIVINDSFSACAFFY